MYAMTCKVAARLLAFAVFLPVMSKAAVSIYACSQVPHGWTWDTFWLFFSM